MRFYFCKKQFEIYKYLYVEKIIKVMKENIKSSYW